MGIRVTGGAVSEDPINLERITICEKAIGGSQVNLCPRVVLGALGQKPSGLRPLGFLALGLAEDVALGFLLDNPSGLQSTPRGRLSTQGTTRGHRFTWLPPMAFPQIVILSKFRKS